MFTTQPVGMSGKFSFDAAAQQLEYKTSWTSQKCMLVTKTVFPLFWITHSVDYYDQFYGFPGIVTCVYM